MLDIQTHRCIEALLQGTISMSFPEDGITFAYKHVKYVAVKKSIWLHCRTTNLMCAVLANAEGHCGWLPEQCYMNDQANVMGKCN